MYSISFYILIILIHRTSSSSVYLIQYPIHIVWTNPGQSFLDIFFLSDPFTKPKMISRRVPNDPPCCVSGHGWTTYLLYSGHIQVDHFKWYLAGRFDVVEINILPEFLTRLRCNGTLSWHSKQLYNDSAMCLCWYFGLRNDFTWFWWHMLAWWNCKNTYSACHCLTL